MLNIVFIAIGSMMIGVHFGSWDLGLAVFLIALSVGG